MYNAHRVCPGVAGGEIGESSVFVFGAGTYRGQNTSSSELGLEALLKQASLSSGNHMHPVLRGEYTWHVQNLTSQLQGESEFAEENFVLVDFTIAGSCLTLDLKFQVVYLV